MKKKVIQEPEAYYERSTRFMVLFLTGAAILFSAYYFLSVRLLFNMHFILILMFPVVFFVFVNVLFVLFNPLVVVYKEHMEIRLFLFLNKTFYFRDIHKIEISTQKGLVIFYHDGEAERVPFFPIRETHKNEFIQTIFKKIFESAA